MKFVNPIITFLSVALSGFLVYLFDKIWGSSIKWEELNSNWFWNILGTQFKVLDITLFIIIAGLLYFVVKKLFKKKAQRHTKEQQKLMQFNTQVVPEMDVLLKWDVHFHDNGKPFIHDLTAFCTKHQYPTRFMRNVCPDVTCENSRNLFDEHVMKNAIESILIAMQDRNHKFQ